MNKEQAQKRINELKGYYGHLAAWGATSVFLMVLNLITGDEFLWFIIPVLGWGIGVAIHTAQVFWTGNDWEARKMAELTGLKETQDEVHKLTERMDALVTIMSGVDWDNIDPELLQTKRTLESAQADLTKLQASNDPQGQAEVSREIERLEAFVTSPRFAYYDMASRDT